MNNTKCSNKEYALEIIDDIKEMLTSYQYKVLLEAIASINHTSEVQLDMDKNKAEAIVVPMSLRSAHMQLRTDPPIPRISVNVYASASPNSTRRYFEIGNSEH